MNAIEYNIRRRDIEYTEEQFKKPICQINIATGEGYNRIDEIWRYMYCEIIVI